MVEFSFDRDEFRPDPSDRRREASRREQRERDMDSEREQQQQRDDFERERFEREMARQAQEEAVRRVVNDPDIVVDPVLLEVINNPMMEMNRDMVVRRRKPANGRAVIRRSGQFSRQNLLPNLPEGKKRTRSKTKTDKIMSKALAQANKELRKKNGQYRRGVTQADIMRRAHRIRRKMS